MAAKRRKPAPRRVAPRKPAPKKAPPKRKPAPKKPAPKKPVLKTKAQQAQAKKRYANIVKTGQAKGKAAVALARKRTQQSAQKVAAKKAAAQKKAPAKKSSGGVGKFNSQGFTNKQSKQVKKRTTNIVKSGQAKGKAAVELARQRTRTSIQKVEQKKGVKLSPTKKQQAVLNKKNTAPKKAPATPGKKAPAQKRGLGRYKNANDPRLRFAKRPGSKRRIK